MSLKHARRLAIALPLISTPALAQNDVGDTLLAGTSISGVFRTMNLGASWIAGNDGPPQNSLGHFPVMTAFAEVNSANPGPMLALRSKATRRENWRLTAAGPW